MVIIAVIVGACVGSFFSVVLMRFGREKGIFAGRSHCLSCKKPLKWFDLIPLVSFLWLRGKCRSCKQRILIIYPILECTTAVLAGIFVAVRGAEPSLFTIMHGIIMLGLLLLLFFDIKYRTLPDKILVVMATVWLGYAAISDPLLIMRNTPVAFVLGGIFGILYLLSGGRWVGFGDVKMLLVVGFVFGFPLGALVALLAIWAAALVGIVLMAVRGATLKTALPFGAFLAAISIVSLIYYDAFRTFAGYVFS